MKSEQIIDLRSDTVTTPTAAMREYMSGAQVGDDVFAEDPTINAVEKRVAHLLGKEAALLCPSGTQSNLIGILSHCQRGEEYIVGEQYHTYKYEAGGAAVLGGVVPQTLPVEDDGSLLAARVEAAIKADDPHFPVSRLISLENTHLGKIVPQAAIESVKRVARKHNLSLHLDGARLFNASVKTGRTVKELAEPFDSVSVCFSKGLGTPVGSLLCGSAEFIRSGRRWRKMLGGGMRQAGIIASAMDYALDHHIERLAQDHENAILLAEGLSQLTELDVETPQTNMVYVNFKDAARAGEVSSKLCQQGIRVPAQQSMRLVTHLNVDQEDIALVVERFAQALA